MDFEKGDDSVPLSENGAALAPYVCPGDELTIGYGCTHWFDGEPVQIHHRLEGEADALQLLMFNLTSYEDCVRGALTREATQNQFDGMVCLCFNIGKAAFLGSSVLKSFNEGRMEDAAANFGLWTGSTTARPRKQQINDSEYAPKLKQNHKGIWCWIGPEGQYCSYMLRLEGLLSRHYSEALLFMSRDWTRTLRSSTAMELTLEPTAPSLAEWDAGKGRWIDKVRYRTPFKDVYARAYDDRLVEAPTQTPADKVAAASVQSPASAGELILSTKAPDQPAAPVATVSKEGAAVEVPTPAAASSPAATKTNSASAAESRPAPGSVAPPPSPSGAGASTLPAPAPLPKVTPAPAPKPAEPPVIAGQDGAKPKSPWTVQPEEVHYKLDPSAGLKPLEDSDRAKAFVMQRLFLLVIYLGAAGLFGSTFTAGSELLMKHPALMSVILDLGVPLALSLLALFLGAVGKSWADWRRHCAQERASQGLY
jgi:lysozyme